MKRIDLNGVWTMTGGGYCCDGTVPGSVYSFLLDAKLMEDPFYRDNEDHALALMEHDYTFTRTFAHTLTTHKVLLCCEGLDTLATITLNGATVASTQNMHRRYEFDVTDLLKDGENTISIRFASPTKYAKKMHAEDPVPGAVSFPYQGFYHLRKAHSMFGWDWGPRLPDAGIWRDIYLLIQDSVRILDAHVTQRHCDGKVYLTPTVETSAPCAVSVTLTAPDGTLTTLSCDRETEVPNPRLWWPNGLGDQPLYTVTFQVEGDTVTRRIGLRTLELVRQPGEQGVGLYHRVNGVPYFAMGANMIPPGQHSLPHHPFPNPAPALAGKGLPLQHHSCVGWGLLSRQLVL